MSLFLGFLPFLLSFILRMFLNARLALGVSAGVGLLALGRQLLNGTPKSLTILAPLLIGSAFLLALRWPKFAERGAGLLVSGGLAAFVLGGIALGSPFSLEWARETAPAAIWNAPAFIETNLIISLVWGLGFALLAVVSLPLEMMPGRRVRSLVAASVMTAAAVFTSWYPAHVRGQYAPVSVEQNIR